MYWDYVKILKGEDGAEDTGITFMQNKEMPHIRYVTGDKGWYEASFIKMF